MSYNAQEISRYTGAPIELYKFVCGAEKWCFTSGDVAVTYNSDVYTPDLVERTAVSQTQEQSSGAIDVTVLRDNIVPALFIPYLPVLPVSLTIYRKHRSDPEVVTIFVGKVVTVRFEGSDAIISCTPASQILQKRIPVNVYQRQCNHALYSPKCGIDKESWFISGTVTAINGYVLTVSGLNIHGDGWHAGGWVQRANGDMRFIFSQTGNDIELQSAFKDIVVGEVVKVYAGCDRSETTCNSKFNNLVNHLGWARVPTKNPFDGSIV